ncbi:hypothetical protein [uncultured Gemmiger sp.]|uniref:hypothetical protein n=1 Tax=uncultured Gemmiger sp. TaxID=1623490 RepID=UPI0025FCC159|nr:hypothetical protein [uncultured Gemmiger sp.]
MAKPKHNSIFYALLALIGIGVVLELIGGLLLSPPVGIGINTNISPVTYVGLALVIVGLIAYIAICVVSKKLTYTPILKDILMLGSIMAFILSCIFIGCVIVWPTIFPANG